MSTTTAAPSLSAKSAVVKGLETLLANSYALMGQTHLAHWNVEGPNFFQLHTAFQTQYEELFTAIDEIAERIRALDALSPGGLTALAKLSRVTEMPSEAAPAKDFVAHLIDCHEVLLQDALELRAACEAAGDLETQDLDLLLVAHRRAPAALMSGPRARP